MNRISSPRTQRSARPGARALPLIALFAGGCASAAPAPAPAAALDECIVLEEPARPRIVVAAEGPIDIPPPTLTFTSLRSAHVSDPLVRSDCTGALRPGLAESWESDDGLTWRFRIVSGATFSDGSPVTAAEIGSLLMAASSRAIASVAVAGPRDLLITLHGPEATATFATALSFAEPLLPHGAIAGRYQPDPRQPANVWLARQPDAFTPDTIAVQLFPADSRRALDRNVDVLVTADGASLDYARALPDYELIPLPWHATYVVASPARSGPVHPEPRDLEALARTAVRAPVRATEPVQWWQSCGPWTATGRRTASLDIMYVEHDAAARDIAERLVALAWPRERAPAWVRDALPPYAGPPRARPVSEATIASGTAANALARVLLLPRSASRGCAGIAPWLELPGGDPSIAITPLLDVRRFLVHRGGIGRVRVDAAGVIRIGR